MIIESELLLWYRCYNTQTNVFDSVQKAWKTRHKNERRGDRSSPYAVGDQQSTNFQEIFVTRYSNMICSLDHFWTRIVCSQTSVNVDRVVHIFYIDFDKNTATSKPITSLTGVFFHPLISTYESYHYYGVRPFN